MLYVLLVLIALGVWLFCLFDVLTTEEGDVRFLPKFGWFLVVLIGFQLGSVVWLLLGRPRRSITEPRAQVWPPAGQPHPDAPKGPDDDPDFLRNLDRRINGDD